MSRFDIFTERALDLASSAGDSFRHVVPSGAGNWFEAGAKLGALKGGARVASMVVRRHPAVAIATVAGAGLLWYAAKRRARQQREAPIDGTSKRIEARRAERPARKKTTARKRATKTATAD